MKHQYI